MNGIEAGRLALPVIQQYDSKMTRPPTLTKQPAELAAMEDFDLCDYIWQLVSDEYYNQEEQNDDPPCNCPESLFAMELPEHWWTAYGVHAFEYDVHASGLREFLDNHSGLTNRRTAEAFRTLGQPELAEAFLKVGDAYVDFSTERFPKDRELDDEECRTAYSELGMLIRELETDFRRIHRGIDLRSLAAAYIRSNLSLFTA
jgi:hypothetical protein